MDYTDVIQLARKLLKENPNITVAEMLHLLHISHNDPKRCIYSTYDVLKPTLSELCSAAVKEFKQPLISKADLKDALKECGFSESDMDKQIQACYPDDKRYAIVLSGSSHDRPRTVCNAAYNVGTGDFTVEGWVKPLSGGGTILSRKPTPGCWGNGGFLLVLKPDGVIKLATDDGMGFYEVNSEAVAAYDGNYHHVLGLRRGETLEVYFDFKKLAVTERTDRHSGLDINNSLGVTIGATEQVQEPYNYFNGNIGECRMWKIAKTYNDKTDWANTDYTDTDIIGMWGFWCKSGNDYSATANMLPVTGCQFEEWSL